MKIKHEIEEKLNIPILRIIGTILNFGLIPLFHFLIKMENTRGIAVYYVGILTSVLILYLMWMIWQNYIPEYRRVVIHKI